MVELERKAFTDGLPELAWMDPQTQQRALHKAEQMIMKIGYPQFVAHASDLDKYYERVSVTPSNIT